MSLKLHYVILLASYLINSCTPTASQNDRVTIAFAALVLGQPRNHSRRTFWGNFPPPLIISSFTAPSVPKQPAPQKP